MAVKKTSKKAATTRKAASTSKKTPAIQKKYTKTQILNEIANNTELSKKDVAAVLDELGVLIERHIKKTCCRRIYITRAAENKISGAPGATSSQECAESIQTG